MIKEMKNWPKKDCKNCKNCDSIHGFMSNCHYSYDENGHHYQCGQYVSRGKAESCDYYTEQEYDRDKFFVI